MKRITLLALAFMLLTPFAKSQTTTDKTQTDWLTYEEVGY